MEEREQEDFWDDLLTYLEDRRVIPIVGPGLLEVEAEGARQPFLPLVARHLARRLRVAEPAPGEGLNDVVVRFIAAHGRREEVYPRLRSILKELQVAPPEALRRLARIPAFDLFVSLTFDDLLARAIDAERFGGQPTTEHLGYAPGRVQDLPAERAKLSRPLVYGLFGKALGSTEYVITEEDTLEYLHALQTDLKRPKLLFDELETSHLLIMGCGFPDWLARFFIRTAKSRQLSSQRGESEIFVDDKSASDPNLVLFLKSFSYATRVIASNPADFVAELERRWAARHPGGVAAAPSEAQAADEARRAAAAVPGSVFLSYAHEDQAAVERIQQSLEALGIQVWFDRERLEPGDQYDQKIRRHIRSCSYFVPVLSRATERRLEGYFRREWKLAEERAFGIAEHIPFIVPVVVDDTPEYAESFPERLRNVQWTRLPGGNVTPEFERHMVRLIREYRARAQGLE